MRKVWLQCPERCYSIYESFSFRVFTQLTHRCLCASKRTNANKQTEYYLLTLEWFPSHGAMKYFIFISRNIRINHFAIRCHIFSFRKIRENERQQKSNTNAQMTAECTKDCQLQQMSALLLRTHTRIQSHPCDCACKLALANNLTAFFRLRSVQAQVISTKRNHNSETNKLRADETYCRRNNLKNHFQLW